MILTCPKCTSFLLVRYGPASVLDGRRGFRCLSCRSEFGPRRYRPLYRFFFLLAVLFPIPLAAAGIALAALAGGPNRYAISLLVLAGLCVYAAVLCRRALRSDAPDVYPFPDFPDPKVSVDALKVRITSGTPVSAGWVTPFGEYLNAVLGAAARHLRTSGTSGRVHVMVEFSSGPPTVSVGYQGRVAADSLDGLDEEVRRRPAVRLDRGKATLDVWFRFRP